MRSFEILLIVVQVSLSLIYSSVTWSRTSFFYAFFASYFTITFLHYIISSITSLFNNWIGSLFIISIHSLKSVAFFLSYPSVWGSKLCCVNASINYLFSLTNILHSMVTSNPSIHCANMSPSHFNYFFHFLGNEISNFGIILFHINSWTSICMRISIFFLSSITCSWKSLHSSSNIFNFSEQWYDSLYIFIASLINSYP